MKKILLAFACCTSLTAFAQDPYMKFINNIADPTVPAVDVYMGTQLIYDNLAYREATNFLIGVFSASGIEVGVAPQNSTSSADVVATASTTITGQDTVIAVFTGTFSSVGYTPYRPVSVSLLPGIRTVANDPLKTDILIINGSTDAPVTDIRSGVTTWGDNLPLGGGAYYIELPADKDTIFRATNTTGGKILETYTLPLATDMLAGQSIVIVASGYANPAANNNGQPYGMLMGKVMEHGTLNALATAAPESYARLQLINNSADQATNKIDIYIDGTKTVDDLQFRNATEFMDVWADQPYTVAVAPENSTSAGNGFYTKSITLAPGKAHVLVTNGIISTTGYYPPIPFTLSQLNNAKEEAAISTANPTELIMHNGCTDCPTIDIRKPDNTYAGNDLNFGDFATGYISLTGTVPLIVTDMMGTDTIKTFDALPNPNVLEGHACVVAASGFVAPQNNSNGPAFGLFAATPAGGALVPLAVIPDVPGNAGNIQLAGNAVSLWPNPAANILYISTRGSLTGATAVIYNAAGQAVKLIDQLESKSVDITTLASGTYYIRLQKGAEVSGISKFIRQ